MKKILWRLTIMACLLAPLAAQSVTVTSPNGGEEWPLGTPHAIAWNFQNAGTTKVTLILRNAGGVVGTIQSNVALSAGNWLWASVGTLENGTIVTPGSGYIVRIRDVGNTFGDNSDSGFAIQPATTPPGGKPALQLTSPNGGESWPSGGTRNVTWTAANWSGNVQLSLAQNGAYKGIIATVPSAPGTYPWVVGKTDKGAAEIGGGYTVRVSRVYADMKPHAALADASDGMFSVGPMKPDGGMAMKGFQVAAPGEGNVYEYSSLVVNNERAVAVKCRWTADSAGPFQFFLHNVGNKAEVALQPIKAPISAGNGSYEAELKLTTKNSAPGWYKIHVKSDAGGGYSGKFQLKFRLLEVTLTPTILNRYHFAKSTNDEKYFWTIKTDPGSIQEGCAKVGFHNGLQKAGGGRYCYIGFVYRARIAFDLSRFKGNRGKFLEAKLQFRPHFFGHSPAADIDMSDCGVRIYALAEPWDGNDFFAIPGNLIQGFPQGDPNSFDIPDWAAAWADGTSPNHGLLLVGAMEKMNHDSLYCLNQYPVRLKIRFQEE